MTISITIEFSNNFCSYMLWSLTTSKSGHQNGCQFVSTHLKSDEVKICFYFISTLLLDHVLLKMDNRKFFAIKGPKMVLKKAVFKRKKLTFFFFFFFFFCCYCNKIYNWVGWGTLAWGGISSPSPPPVETVTVKPVLSDHPLIRPPLYWQTCLIRPPLIKTSSL